MNTKSILVIILPFLPLFSSGQTYPRNYFSSPLDTPLVITGTFGEIRDNHFHTGIDISTEDQEGKPVSSIADGYVSRIKVSAEGYGKALYITHPNGYVSVYGHLQKFAGPLYSFVRKYQYDNQTYEFDKQFKENEFKVKMNEVVAYSGSTGSADNPHLHFEIRDELTEDPINPLLFGFRTYDSIAPLIKEICIYPRNEKGIVNNTGEDQTYQVVDNSETGFQINAPEFPIAYGDVGFGIEADDRADTNQSVLGIYSAELFVDEKPVFTWRYDRLRFDNNIDVNAHIDYSKKVKEQINMERFYKLPGDRLNIYGTDSMLTGSLFFGQDSAHDVKMVVRDFMNNQSELKFQVITHVSDNENPYPPKSRESVLVTTEKGVAIHKGNLDVVITEGSAYDDFYYDDGATNSYKYQSDIFRIGDRTVALRKPMTIGLKPNEEIPDSLKSKALIARFGEFEEIYACGGSWNGKLLSTKTQYFGEYAIMLDTIPPKVEKYYVPADMDGMYGGEVQIKITDDLSGIKSYRGMIDDKWYLFEYEKKSNMLIANIDALPMNNEHSIEITVTDERGNTKVWKSSFYF